MKKVTNGIICMSGSRKEIDRAIYTDGKKYFVKWYGQYIEVYNIHGGIVTSGWRTVEAY